VWSVRAMYHVIAQDKTRGGDTVGVEVTRVLYRSDINQSELTYSQEEVTSRISSGNAT